MADRLTAKRVNALLDLLANPMREERSWLEGAIGELSPADGEEWAARLRHHDERLRLATEARDILHARYLAPKPTPHPVRPADPTLPGFEN